MACDTAVETMESWIDEGGRVLLCQVHALLEWCFHRGLVPCSVGLQDLLRVNGLFEGDRPVDAISDQLGAQ
eukprot:1154254-Rhodomonas_salina.2